MRSGFGLALMLAALCVRAQSSVEAVTGVVFVDADSDGVFDAGEDGVPGVKLSDGRDVVVTRTNGRYRLEVGAGTWTTPASSSASTSASGNR